MKDQDRYAYYVKFHPDGSHDVLAFNTYMCRRKYSSVTKASLSRLSRALRDYRLVVDSIDDYEIYINRGVDPWHC